MIGFVGVRRFIFESSKTNTDMNNATITKTLNKVESQDKNYSLGFKRYISLPARLSKALKLSIYLKTGSINTHDAIVKFFNEMTQDEYINYLKAN